MAGRAQTSRADSDSAAGSSSENEAFQSASSDDEGAFAHFDEEDEDDDISDDEPDSQAKELATLSFGSLAKARKRLARSQLAAGGDEDDASAGSDSDTPQAGPSRPSQARAKNDKARRGGSAESGRSNKHAPMEMSSKRPVKRTRAVAEESKPRARDPRFEATAGKFDQNLYRRSYDFLNESRRAELQELKKSINKAKRDTKVSAEEREKLQRALVKMESREAARRDRERGDEALAQWKKQEREQQAQGKKPFHLKKNEKNALKMRAKFEDLSKDKRKMRKTMDRKRRRDDQKEKKKMPALRQP